VAWLYNLKIEGLALFTICLNIYHSRGGAYEQKEIKGSSAAACGRAGIIIGCFGDADSVGFSEPEHSACGGVFGRWVLVAVSVK